MKNSINNKDKVYGTMYNNDTNYDKEVKVAITNFKSSNVSNQYIDIDIIINNLGLHKYNIIMLILICLALVCDGIEMYTINILLPVLKIKFDMNTYQNSIVASSSMIGSAIGVYFSSYLSNKYGDRKPFIVISLIISVVGSISVLIDNYIYFVVCRIIIGICIGISINYVNCLFENLPKNFRSIIATFIFIGVEVGVIYYILLFYYFSIDKEPIEIYKKVVVISTVPMYICLILSYFYFQESPRKLLWSKKYVELYNTLDKYSGIKNYLSNNQKAMLVKLVSEKEKRLTNSIQNESNNINMITESNVINSNYKTISLDENNKEISELQCDNKNVLNNKISFGSLNSIIYKLYFRPVLMQMLLWIISLLILVNVGYYLPRYLETLTLEAKKIDKIHGLLSNSSNLKKLLISTFISMCGDFIGGFLAFMNIKRKKIISYFFLLSCLFSLLKIAHIESIEYYSSGVRICCKICLNFIRLYTSEFFHTDYRDTVYSLCGFSARTSIILSPFICDYLISINILYPNFFEIIISIIGFLLTINLSIETLNKPIDDIEVYDKSKKIYTDININKS